MATSLKPGAVRLYQYSVRRRRARGVPERALRNDQQVANLFRETLTDQMHREHFCVFYLDLHERLLGIELIAVGASDVVYVHPTEVFRGALLAGARGVVLSHNHPSGDPTPSQHDDDLTIRMYNAGEILGVAVMDHIVVVDHRHYSYAQNDRKPWTTNASNHP